MPRILIVEDEESVRQLYTDFLEKKGYKVETAENGQKALDFLSDKRPDLILSDMNMPEINGKELIKIIIEDEKLRDIPVFIITGVDDVDEINECLSLGARGYIEKSNSLGEFLSKIEIAFGTSIKTPESNPLTDCPRKLADLKLGT